MWHLLLMKYPQNLSPGGVQNSALDLIGCFFLNSSQVASVYGITLQTSCYCVNFKLRSRTYNRGAVKRMHHSTLELIRMNLNGK